MIMKAELVVVFSAMLLFCSAGGMAIITGEFCHNCANDLELKDDWPLCTEKENAGNPLCETRTSSEPAITRRDSIISLDTLYKGNYGYEKNKMGSTNLSF